MIHERWFKSTKWRLGCGDAVERVSNATSRQSDRDVDFQRLVRIPTSFKESARGPCRPSRLTMGSGPTMIRWPTFVVQPQNAQLGSR